MISESKLDLVQLDPSDHMGKIRLLLGLQNLGGYPGGPGLAAFSQVELHIVGITGCSPGFDADQFGFQ
ncbi:hypothetical protein AB0C28_02810 [Nonomuraea sp. NPDC048892]|uniref:hypothetical protein n=1 Tax=Nonomuraea sp. NPDC048892 TaxID=3154624 RepID=UPI0033C2A4EE